MKYKKNILGILVLAMLCLGFSFSLFNSPHTISGKSTEEDFLEISTGGITIITPENKTYTKPDNGYFPGTYGFENDEVGTIPEDWVLSDDRGGTCKVI
ncbi:MAG: hypothetical protein EU533_02905, partial [Promethearchaeota archaeon]